MIVCDFDMRFTFVVAGWPDLVHDTRVFNEALQKYVDKFLFLPEGINITIVLFIVWTHVFSLTFVINVQGSTTLLTPVTLIRRVSFHHTRGRSTIYRSFDRSRT
jgi:predicted KAP-like P-loop ATPase